MISLVLAAVLALSSPEIPVTNAESTPVVATLAPPEQVMQIPDALRADLQLHVLSKSHLPERRLELLVDYLFLPSGLGMRYQHDATYTVAQAYEYRTANCLSFTLLSIALARAAGLEAYGQDIDETLLWRQDEQSTYRTTHVNAGVRIKDRRYTVDVASDQVLIRHPPTRINDARLLAQYYNNRSAELISTGELTQAEAHAKLSLQLDPLYAASWNNAGVLYLRAGRLNEAQTHYQRALALDADHASALANLASYFEQIGTPEQALPFKRRLQAVQKRNPFHQYLLALQFEEANQLRLAANHYRRAIHLFRHEHRFHFGLARVLFMLGKPETASVSLQRARELSTGETRSLYQAKLDSLEPRKKS
jgi:tetratricopeptide (TPR) repeat protein